MAVRISVIVPTHNPHVGRLVRTVDGLKHQTLAPDEWEFLLVDNASRSEEYLKQVDLSWKSAVRVIPEPNLGLTHARRAGVLAAKADVLLFVDDDNVLAPDYLERVVEAFDLHPAWGVIGGKSIGEFETPPPSWARPYLGLLAIRDDGDESLSTKWEPGGKPAYPKAAPIGAGMGIRTPAAQAYLRAIDADPRRRKFDRTGTQLVSGGDNDLVLTAMGAGFACAYLPELSLLHLIPQKRLSREYLGAINRAIARSWVSVLGLHGIQPWTPIAPWTVRIRCLRAWFRSKAWSGPGEWIAWQGVCGTFEGQADLQRASASQEP